ncbi:YpoC family protein [Sporolactobacillus pectinivorans]|uniref:YpoC family protein n=1 Tax=Sporolactobacillus pectinivorans TaxID=1591408 RepID=UPI000C268DE3|nr:hypothetical protein [Sporolactobacillus pectinivorans]
MENKATRLKIPEPFCFLPYFEKQAVISFIDHSPTEENIPFFYDILYAAGFSSGSPWPWQTGTPHFRKLWDKMRPRIKETFHRRRPDEARKPMIYALSSFIDQMFWASDRPVHTLSPDILVPELLVMPYAPLNLGERLKYIHDQPDRYLSFIQLDKLQEELGKKLSVYKKIKR